MTKLTIEEIKDKATLARAILDELGALIDCSSYPGFECEGCPMCFSPREKCLSYCDETFCLFEHASDGLEEIEVSGFNIREDEDDE